MRKIKMWLPGLCGLLCFGQVRSEVVLPRILGHQMVLQRDQPVPVWGTAATGEQVTVSFADQS